jgi:hypothetical protein
MSKGCQFSLSVGTIFLFYLEMGLEYFITQSDKHNS